MRDQYQNTLTNEKQVSYLIRFPRTIVIFVFNAVIINVRVTGISKLIIVNVLLEWVTDLSTVITLVPQSIIITVCLVIILMIRTIIIIIRKSISIRIIVTCISYTIMIGVLLPRIRFPYTDVSLYHTV